MLKKTDYEKNINQLIIVANELREHLKEIVFVGGSVVVLLVDDAAAHAARPTEDVDIVVNVAALKEYYEFEDMLLAKGFINDTKSDVACRYKKGSIALDVMTTEEDVLGFTNIWYGPALNCTDTKTLPDGTEIQVISPIYFIATKIEAFKNRGHGDYLSADIEDIVAVMENRGQLLIEMKDADEDLRQYFVKEYADLDNPDFWNHLPGCLDNPDNEFVITNAFKFITSL